jgi:EAL domain-containing protein (putative c-di-GMP-specific phosphodiesterase class I)/CheY-like chemotaxis protein
VTGHVLVVDDEPALLALFAEVLRDHGLTVSTAPNPREALKQIETEGIDAVVSDIVMPGMTGIEFLRALKALDADLPVILATGRPTLETAIQAVEHGAVGYLSKPVTAEALVGAVTRALALRRMARLRREALAYLRTRADGDGDHAGLDEALTRALGSLWMAYQPIVRAADGALYGHEALLRCDEPRLLNPSEVLQAAERLGRVPEVGRAVRGRVAEAIGEGRLGDAVFVNLHALDLTDDSLHAPDGALAAQAGKVVLEITERASLEAIPDARGRIKSLRGLGYRIAVDDLGAGYSGLNSFAALEPDVVKLDIALVRGCHAEPVKRKLIGSLSSLCRELGTLVVAEGVENRADRDVVIDLGCDLLQGFLLGRPSREPALAAEGCEAWPRGH